MYREPLSSERPFTHLTIEEFLTKLCVKAYVECHITGYCKIRLAKSTVKEFIISSGFNSSEFCFVRTTTKG